MLLTALSNSFDMAASTVQNPAVQTESKSAKKKKAKAAAERTDSPAPTASPSPEKADGSDESGESPYIREIQKYGPIIN